MSIQFKIFLIALIAISISISFSQDSQQEAINLLNSNQRKESYQAFQNNNKNNIKDIDSYLGLILVDLGDRKYDAAFDNLVRFQNAIQNIDPYLYSLWTSGLLTKTSDAKSKQVIEFLKKYVQITNNATIKAMIYNQLGDFYSADNLAQLAKQSYEKVGQLKNWSVVGTFENISGSGFLKSFSPLEHPEENFPFKNKINSDIKWYQVKSSRIDNWFDHEYMFDTDNSIIFAQTFVESPDAREVSLLSGVSGSVKIWVNDFLVLSESEERNTDLDVYNVKVRLNQGYNRILIQTGSSEINNNNFMIRLANTSGEVITNLKTSATLKPYTKATSYNVGTLPFWPEHFFSQNQPDNFFHKIMLLEVYTHNDKKLEARNIAEQLKKSAPQSTIISELMCEALARDGNTIDLNKEYEAIKSNDPNSFIALTLKYNEVNESEDYDKCQEILNQIKTKYGENENTFATQMSIYSKKKDYVNYLQAIESGYKKYPNSSFFVLNKYNLETNVKKNVKSAIKILEEYNKTHFNEEVKSRLINDYFELGNLKKGFEALNELTQIFPYSTFYFTELAKRCDNIQNYANAINFQLKAIEIAPYFGSLYHDLGIYYESNNQKGPAEEMYQKAIYYAPELSEARKKLTTIRGQKDIFSNFRIDDIEAIVKNAPKSDQYPEDNSIYLLSDVQQVIYPENGVSEQKHHYLIKILNQKGIESWKELSIPLLRSQRLILEKAELIKTDGKSKVPAETDYNQLVFSSLEIGDIIHINYKLESVIVGKLAEHFWEDQVLNGEIPYLISRYSLIVPKYKTFKYKSFNLEIEPEITNLTDNDMYIWERKNLPAIKHEPYMPPLTDVVERVSISSIPDWNYVANWYQDLSSVKTKGDYEVKRVVSHLFAEKQDLSDLEKAKLIYKYIEENYNYSNIDFLHSALVPQSAARTIRTKLGDCKDLSTLFVAMCKEIGIEANLILVDTRDNGDSNLDLPSIGFNHCIAQFKNAGNNHIIELTNNYLPFGAMSNDLLNTNGLYIPKDGENAKNAQLTKLNTKSRPQNLGTRNSVITFNGRNAEITRRSTRTGIYAASIRYDYKNIGLDEQKKNLSMTLSNDFSKNIKINNIKFKNLDNLEDTLLFDYDFSVENYITELVGLKVFSLPWADAFHTQDFVSLEKRKYDFCLWQFTNAPYQQETIKLTIPQGKTLAEKPTDITLKGPGLTYSLKFKLEGNQLLATRKLEYHNEVIKKDDYGQFKDFISKMNEMDNKQYAFK